MRDNWIATDVVVRQCTCTKCGGSFEARKTEGMALHPNCWPQKCERCRHAKKIRKCKTCGNEFTKTSESFSKYCSDECQRIGYKRLRPPSLCSMCGISFRASGGGCVCQACKEEQRQERDAHRRNKIRVCQHCGNEYMLRGQNGKYCTPCGNVIEQERRNRFSNEMRRRGRKTGTVPPDKSRTGQRGEMLFDMCCMKHGWMCCKSVYEQQPSWDRLICRDETKWERVQIKSFSSSTCDGCAVSIPGNTRISIDNCDSLAMVDVDTAGVWILTLTEEVPRTFHMSENQNDYYNAIVTAIM